MDINHCIIIAPSTLCCNPSHRCCDCGQHVIDSCNGIDCGEGARCALYHDCPTPSSNY